MHVIFPLRNELIKGYIVLAQKLPSSPYVRVATGSIPPESMERSGSKSTLKKAASVEAHQLFKHVNNNSINHKLLVSWGNKVSEAYSV